MLLLSRSSRTTCGYVRQRGFRSGLRAGSSLGTGTGARGAETDPNESDALELMVGGGIAVHARSQCSRLAMAGTREGSTQAQSSSSCLFPGQPVVAFAIDCKEGAPCTRLSAAAAEVLGSAGSSIGRGREHDQAQASGRETETRPERV